MLITQEIAKEARERLETYAPVLRADLARKSRARLRLALVMLDAVPLDGDPSFKASQKLKLTYHSEEAKSLAKQWETEILFPALHLTRESLKSI